MAEYTGDKEQYILDLEAENAKLREEHKNEIGELDQKYHDMLTVHSDKVSDLIEGLHAKVKTQAKVIEAAKDVIKEAENKPQPDAGILFALVNLDKALTELKGEG